MAYTATGTAGNDTLNQSTDAGPGSIVGLGGNDCDPHRHRPGHRRRRLGRGHRPAADRQHRQVTGGTENDSIFSLDHIGSMVLFGNEGADTIWPVHLDQPRRPSLAATTSPTATTASGAAAAPTSSSATAATTRSTPAMGNDTDVGGFGNDSLYDQAA